MLMVTATGQTSSIVVNNQLESCTTPFNWKTTSITGDRNDNLNYMVLTCA